jgi:hypothetical protein
MVVDQGRKYAIIAARYGLEPLAIVARLKDASVAHPLLVISIQLSCSAGQSHDIIILGRGQRVKQQADINPSNRG